MTKETPAPTRNKPLPMAYIQEHLAVCPESPSGLRWLTKRASNKPGPAGCTIRKGYRYVSIRKVPYATHRVIYALHTGEDPGALQVDHMDGDTLNNHPDNLRGATHSQNGQNRNRNSNNTSGVAGVSWVASSRRWVAQVRADGVRVTKYFKDITEAAAWITAKRLEVFGEFAPENRQGPIENTAQVTTEPAQACLFD